MLQKLPRMLPRHYGRITALLVAALAATPPEVGPAETVTLNSGMEFEGQLGNISEIGQTPLDLSKEKNEGKATKIVLIDDVLRHTFVSENQVRPGGLKFGAAAPHERFEIPKRVARSGIRIKSVGQFTRVEPFDEFGNRIVSMNTPKGGIDVIQGITEVTPHFARVEGLLVEGKSYVWDMRLATSSLRRSVLTPLLMKSIDPANPDDRLRIVRLYLQANRFHDAQAELEDVLAAFPQLVDKREQLRKLRQLAARRLTREIELRRDAGQHQLAVAMLRGFPEKGVAGVELLKVKDILDEYQRTINQARQLLAQLESDTQALEDERLRERVDAVRQEMADELNLNTLARLADYARLADDSKLTVSQKLALAVSGWLLGSGAGNENLAVALSLYDVRNAVRDYLRAPADPGRQMVLDRLATLEGAEPKNLARLIAQMKPPVEVPESAATEIPGLFKLQTAGLRGTPDVTYLVQLPPEYDPYRRYPCVVTLNGAGTNALRQIDWWAGQYSPKSQMRLGQASRQGVIVVAPVWTKPNQYRYDYSAREHAAVLYSRLDAQRHFSIDTDRVFLSGHSMGGDAAWDIGLAHPHLWAGIVPIVAKADKYVERYWENGRRLPMYFVCGEMDGNKIAQNGPQWNRYLNKHTYNTIVVQYQGRGHEHYYDEIQRIFQWMKLTPPRDPFPEEFEVVTMRPWDNVFWWAELSGFPSRSMVAPASWDADSGSARAGKVEGKLTGKNRVYLRSASEKATVWLAPEMVDFSQRISISFNGRSKSMVLEPSTHDLLEDARTRCDRQHLYWLRVRVGRG